MRLRPTETCSAQHRPPKREAAERMSTELQPRRDGRVSSRELVSVPRGYKRVAAQMDAIHRQFKDGASMTRLSRKHSLPRSTVEFIIRMKMLGHANVKAEP